MSEKEWNRRKWLNGEGSHYTGGVVCCDFKEVENRGKVLSRYTFIEISDCHGKVRIHRDNNLEMKDFVEKIKLLETELREFREYLESEEGTSDE